MHFSFQRDGATVTGHIDEIVFNAGGELSAQGVRFTATFTTMSIFVTSGAGFIDSKFNPYVVKVSFNP